MIVFPNAKINIGLHITSKRPDGFHNIETVFYPVPLNDVLEIIPNDSPNIEFSNFGIEIPGNTENNLCIKAYQALRADFDLPHVKIILQKNIPMGAGMGGGSSDGAFTLVVLNKMFNLGLTELQLEQYASKLGSDCAFFIRNKPALGSEKGNVLENIAVNLQGLYLVIVKPNVHIGTAEAYAGVTPQIPELSLKEITSLPVNQWKELIKNDFEDSIFPKHAEIKEIKDNLYKNGALYASMTGSGAAVFGIFEQEVDLKNLFKGMFYWGAKL
ncbi:MAG TPA: 4-(cytidine 5'-diphospho)-2-C-methyl-D-erythritol kinase [Bacteroidales bacterium]|nr:4-(cytidine 5'-diphospho)-2-C-methyl-D-erythritol kinase [Bacteroidales bacterium]